MKRLLIFLLCVVLIGSAGSEVTAKKKAVSYDPQKVVKLAIKRCVKGGMITTEQHLDDYLREGKITKEEYDEYYPLDGMEGSYYSVFINTDLKKAATFSGRKLKTVKGIAKHIAGMLLLEEDPLFNIRYTGKVKLKRNTFYEFRCYR